MERKFIEISIVGYLMHGSKTSFNYIVGEPTKIKLSSANNIIIQIKCYNKPIFSAYFNSVEITNNEVVFLSAGNFLERFKTTEIAYIL